MKDSNVSHTQAPAKPVSPVAHTDRHAKSTWAEQQTKLKAKYPTLTDADFKFEEGKKEMMMEKLRIKVGKSKEELATIIAAL